MSSILLRIESASSSQIENLTVGAKELALAEIGQARSDNAQVVTANVRTMEAALALSGQLDEDSILAMHHELLSGQPGGNSTPGGTATSSSGWVRRRSHRAVPLTLPRSPTSSPPPWRT